MSSHEMGSGAIVVLKQFAKRMVTGNNPLKKYHLNQESATLSRAEQQALNVGVILAEMNNEYINSLKVAKHNAVEYQKGLLSKWWGIGSPEEAEKILEWLKNKGHRKIFSVILKNSSAALEREPSFKDFRLACEEAGLSLIEKKTQEKYERAVGLVGKYLDVLYSIHTKMPDKEIDNLIEENNMIFYDIETFKICIKIYRTVSVKYNEYIKYIRNLRQSLGKLRYRGFADEEAGFRRINPAAWDMGRLVNVARWCYGCGYITESKAWEYIFFAEKESTDCYTNWASFGNAYM
ncbi:MAG: DUF1266 domain-containing protein, partial [Peptococcaceae bacterium]|nr:DUF1266 domain-containing protein [Peptococcaceae bacterium]